MLEREFFPPIHQGLHIVITESNQREMMASVNPISPRMKDWFKPDRLAFHEVLQTAQNVLPEERDHTHAYAVNSVPLMVGGHFETGNRRVKVKSFRGLPQCVISETWFSQKGKTALTCKYSFNDKKRLFLKRDVLYPFPDEIKPSDMWSFTGMRGASSFVSVAEARQIRQTLANDLMAIRMVNEE